MILLYPFSFFSSIINNIFASAFQYISNTKIVIQELFTNQTFFISHLILSCLLIIWNLLVEFFEESESIEVIDGKAITQSSEGMLRDIFSPEENAFAGIFRIYIGKGWTKKRSIFGWFSTTIFGAALSDKEKEAVIQHEWGHICTLATPIMIAWDVFLGLFITMGLFYLSLIDYLSALIATSIFYVILRWTLELLADSFIKPNRRKYDRNISLRSEEDEGIFWFIGSPTHPPSVFRYFFSIVPAIPQRILICLLFFGIFFY